MVVYARPGTATRTASPRPLLALLRPRDRPAIVTVQIYTVEAEERSSVAFNPLARPCGYLSLDREAVAGLVSILESCAVQLTPSPGGACPMFRKLAEGELKSFGLSPVGPQAGDKHYAQVRDPLAAAGEGVSETIVILSAGCPGPRSRLYFKIAHFARSALERPEFDVLDDSLARIDLDRDGIRELARLLDAQLEGMKA